MMQAISRCCRESWFAVRALRRPKTWRSTKPTMVQGGYAWEKAGLIWYKTLCDRLKPLSNFGEAVRLTCAVAKELFGAAEAKAVKDAWKVVGL